MGGLTILLLKLLAIAFVAAVLSWLPVAGSFWLGANEQHSWGIEMPLRLFPIALIGSFGVGFPIAALVYFLAKDQLRKAPGILFLIANLAGTMMILTSYFLTDASGMLLLGVPSLIAANVFALLGWFWILKPGRSESKNIGGVGQ